jgi:hypothetical protein
LAILRFEAFPLDIENRFGLGATGKLFLSSRS